MKRERCRTRTGRTSHNSQVTSHNRTNSCRVTCVTINTDHRGRFYFFTITLFSFPTSVRVSTRHYALIIGSWLVHGWDHEDTYCTVEGRQVRISVVAIVSTQLYVCSQHMDMHACYRRCYIQHNRHCSSHSRRVTCCCTVCWLEPRSDSHRRV
jgi:hypothetical protein